MAANVSILHPSGVYKVQKLGEGRMGFFFTGKSPRDFILQMGFDDATLRFPVAVKAVGREGPQGQTFEITSSKMINAALGALGGGKSLSRQDLDAFFSAAPAPTGQPPSRRQQSMSIARSIAYAALFGASILAVTVAAYGRVGKIRSYGFVTSSKIELVRSPQPGIFHNYLSAGSQRLRAGELIGLLETANGRTITIASACECFLGDALVRSNTPVLKHSVLARLVPVDSELQVRTRLSLSEIGDIRAGDEVLIASEGSGQIPGTVTGVYREGAANLIAGGDVETEPYAEIVIAPSVALANSLTGTQVEVSFSRVETILNSFINRVRGS